MKDLVQQVDEILFRFRDPIGVSVQLEARDEYSAFAPQMVRILAQGAEQGIVAHALLRIEKEELELEGDPARSAKIAAMLISLRAQGGEGLGHWSAAGRDPAP